MIIKVFLQPWVNQPETKRAPYQLDPLLSRFV
jgi:hypothetical protein